MELSNSNLETALSMLEERLHIKNAPPVRLVVCGGSALIARGLVSRSTKDVAERL